jgi:DNA-directed RNA polymerase specialized sigma24 family protein
MPSPFDEFLSWLSPAREEAGMKYEELRRKLVKYFSRGGCHVPDELADETIDRASKSIAGGKLDRSVDPNAYCFGIARNVLREYWRKPQSGPLDPDLPFVNPEPTWSDQELACLDECWAQLSVHHRDLLTRWHQCGKGQDKIEAHKKMAEQEGCGMNTLRTRIHRIQNSLRDCVAACLRREIIYMQ